jgi:integrase
MSRRSKGIRLYWRNVQRDANGRVTHAATYVIVDGSKRRGTGLGLDASEDEKAEVLRNYLIERAAKTQTGHQQLRDPSKIPIPDVLAKYVKDVVMKMVNPDDTLDRIAFLKTFWAKHTLDYINGDTCDEYVEFRTTPNVARRELEDFRAAIIHHRLRGGHDRIISVSLPDKPKPREQWMTIRQAAAAVRAAWRYEEFAEEEFTGLCKIHSRSRDKVWYYAYRNGPRIFAEWGTPEFKTEFQEKTKERRQRIRHTRRHIARFMVFESYMGSRSAVALSTSIEPKRPKGRPWIDLKTGLFLGLPQDQRETNKQRQQVYVPPALLAHLRRWAKNGQNYVVEFGGKPVGDIHKAHDATIAAAGLPDDVTPHTWRHSLATWLMQDGVLEDSAIARWLGMTVATLQLVYGHHRRDKSEAVHAAFRSARRASFVTDMREHEANQTHLDVPKRRAKSEFSG